MQIIERPPLTSALRANSRATLTASRRSTVVIASCHAGVYGVLGVVVALRPLARQPVARDAVGREHQVEHGRHEPAADADRRHAAAHRRAARARRRRRSAAARPRPPRSWRPCRESTGSSVAEPQVPAALALLAVAEADRAVGHRRLARDGVEQRPASSRRARSRRRGRRPSGSGPARARRRAPRARRAAAGR